MGVVKKHSGCCCCYWPWCVLQEEGAAGEIGGPAGTTPSTCSIITPIHHSPLSAPTHPHKEDKTYHSLPLPHHLPSFILSFLTLLMLTAPSSAQQQNNNERMFQGKIAQHATPTQSYFGAPLFFRSHQLLCFSSFLEISTCYINILWSNH